MKIKVVFFDVGETLLYRNPSLTTIVYRFLKKVGYKFKKYQIDNFLKETAKEMKPVVEKARLNDSQKWELFIKKFFRKIKFKNFEKVTKIKERLKKGTSFRKFKDVDKTFDFLKKNGIKIGIISNAPKELKEILKRTGILQKVDFLFISEEVGFEKPHKNIFEYALKKAKVFRDECLFVGDNYIADIKGAKRVGILPFWINRDSDNMHFSYKDNYDKDILKIKNLTELIEFIKNRK